MPLPIIVDGAEKAGKTTFIREFANLFGYKVRKQSGPAIPDFTMYYDQLFEDIRSGERVIWDRSWASEFVYGALMLDRHVPDPYQMEEMLSPLACVKIMLLGPGDEKHFASRDETDMPVNPFEEREAFRRYGKQFGWTVFENQHNRAWSSGLLFMVRGLVAVSRQEENFQLKMRGF